MYNSHNHTHAPTHSPIIHTCTCTCISTYTHSQIHTHMRIHTHTHTIAVGAIPIQQITEYMRSNEAYRFCLSEFQTVSANDRNFFATFDDTATMASIEEAIANDPALRQFIG